MDWNHPLHPQKNASTHNSIVAEGRPKKVNFPGVKTKKLSAKQIFASPARISPVGKNFLTSERSAIIPFTNLPIA